MRPSDRKELLREAASLASSGEAEEALQIVGQLLVERQNDIEALSLKGNISEMLDSHIEARQCYEEILANSPTHVKAIIDLADTYTSTGDLELAMPLYDRAIDLLNRGFFVESLEEELEDAYWSKLLALRDGGELQRARECLNV